MELVPVIDLLGGKAVHARGGHREAYRPVESVLLPGRSGDAVALARACRQLTAVTHCYVADLDAIQGRPPQIDLIRRLASPEGFGAGLWLDAGVAAAIDIAPLTTIGLDAIIAGLETLSSLRELPAIVREARPTPVVFSLDLRGGEPVRRSEGLSPELLALRAVDAGAQAVVVLDLGAVGSGGGPANLELVTRLKWRLPCPVYLGGGVRGAADLAVLEAAGCDGVLVGTALHAGELAGGY